jgi:hypothetical protein
MEALLIATGVGFLAFRSRKSGGPIFVVFNIMRLFFLDLFVVSFEPLLRLRLCRAGNKRGMVARPGAVRLLVNNARLAVTP